MGMCWRKRQQLPVSIKPMTWVSISSIRPMATTVVELKKLSGGLCSLFGVTRLVQGMQRVCARGGSDAGEECLLQLAPLAPGREWLISLRGPGIELEDRLEFLCRQQLLFRSSRPTGDCAASRIRPVLRMRNNHIPDPKDRLHREPNDAACGERCGRPRRFPYDAGRRLWHPSISGMPRNA